MSLILHVWRQKKPRVQRQMVRYEANDVESGHVDAGNAGRA